MKGNVENASNGKRCNAASKAGNAPSARIVTARQLFLYGDESGKRVIVPSRLAELVGCHVNTIYEHLPAWIEEHERMLVKRSNSEWRIALTEQTLEEFKADVEYARTQKEALKVSLDTVENVEDYLKALLVRIDLSPKETDKALSMIGKYLQTLGAKSHLRDQWMRAEKFWIEVSGLQSLMTVSQTYENETAKARARSDSKRGSGEDGEGRSEPKQRGFFDLPG